VAVEEPLADGLVPPVGEAATNHLYLLSGVTVND
jgi:hypothetical protein